MQKKCTSKETTKATTKCKKKILTGNTVPMLAHSICLQYRPHCSRPGDGTQRSHSGEQTNKSSPTNTQNGAFDQFEPSQSAFLNWDFERLHLPHWTWTILCHFNSRCKNRFTGGRCFTLSSEPKPCYCSYTAALMCLLFVSTAKKWQTWCGLLFLEIE